MNSPNENASIHITSGAGEADETLRLIASLPAPVGLEDRVTSGLREVSANGRVLHWPTRLRTGGGWMNNKMVRSAAAAAIVFVVAGGGWGIYSRVQPAQTPKVIAMPRVSAPGGFSTAGAIRTPQSLNRPVLTHPVQTGNKHADAARKPAAHGKAHGQKKAEN